MSILNTILKTFVGDKSKKDIRAIQHLVDQINKHQLEFEGISNDELREKTAVFKAKITETRKSIDQQISELNAQLQGLAKNKNYLKILETICVFLVTSSWNKFNKLFPTFWRFQ